MLKRGALLKLTNKAVVIHFLGQFSGLHRVLEFSVTSQIVPLALEADDRFPFICGGHPLHAGHAAGIVAADGLGAQQFNTCTVYEGPFRLAAAAGGLPAPQVAGRDPGSIPIRWPVKSSRCSL